MYASGAEQQRGNGVQAVADQLYRERYPHLLRIAIRNAVTEADAEESVNDAFAAFISAFDPSGGAPPLAWITLTMKRKCWEKHRRMYLDRHVGQEAERDSMIPSIPSRALELEERVVERDLARHRLADLKPDERDGLGLLAAGLSYREIAELRGWTYTKVNRCVSEGRRRCGPTPRGCRSRIVSSGGRDCACERPTSLLRRSPESGVNYTNMKLTEDSSTDKKPPAPPAVFPFDANNLSRY